ncbi:MAG: M20/M25/M40 family metallo-hydrolase, partial [Planctomycetota bacterium]
WVDRTGAPRLELRVAPGSGGGEDDLRVEILQVQEGEPYELTVPVAILYEGAEKAEIVEARFEGPEWRPGDDSSRPVVASARLAIEPGRRPLSIQVDPAFDLFRRLDREEIPPSIGDIFGAERVAVVLPRKEREGDGGAFDWAALARSWDPGEGQWEFLREEEISALPGGCATWILGSENRWGASIEPALGEVGASLGDDTLSFGGPSVPREDHAFVVTARHPHDPDLTVGWIGAANPASIPGLARKLPHYGKYSFLAFQGDEPTNDAKGQWPTPSSPLVWSAQGVPPAPMAPPAREPLARPRPAFDPERLFAHVSFLASDEMRGRGVGSEEIDRAAEYIAGAFKEAGLEPGGEDGGWFQSWIEEGGPDGKPVRLQNVIGVLRGGRSGWERQSVVLGAHYDHLGTGWPDVREGERGKIHNGADDNASGVAVLIEVAKILAGQLEPDRTIIFAAFSGEEWELRGSRHYVAQMEAWPAAEAMAMINLDTVGRLEGRAITVLGAGSAREWPHITMGIRFTTGVESTAVEDDLLGASDQRSFFDAGVPAIHLTSGANPDYHRPSDDAGKIDLDGLVKVAVWLREAAVYLSERADPLTPRVGPRAAGGSSSAGAPRPAGAGRRRGLRGPLPPVAVGGAGGGVPSGR